jgi:hypothetical protein
MSHAIRQPRILLALLGSVAALCIGLIGAKPASANWANFCNPVTLPGNGYCEGPAQVMNKLYGWGDQHSVCVGLRGSYMYWRCSSGPGVGVYTPTFEPFVWYPHIQNNAAGTNTVHGVVLSP